MGLWRLRSPVISHLQAGDPEKLLVWNFSESEGLRTSSEHGLSPSPKAREEDQCLKQSGRKN